MSKKFFFFIFLFVGFFIFLFGVSTVFAQSDQMDMQVMDMSISHGDSMGPVLANRMLHAWTSLVASIIIFFLAFKYLKGGQIKKPILLIGVGALLDAIIGLSMPVEDHMRYMWLGSLLFSLAVIFGVIWMMSVFGIFQKTSKEG